MKGLIYDSGLLIYMLFYIVDKNKEFLYHIYNKFPITNNNSEVEILIISSKIRAIACYGGLILHLKTQSKSFYNIRSQFFLLNSTKLWSVLLLEVSCTL